jgi:hypothetical protein
LNKRKGHDTGTRCRPTISNKELNDDLLQYLVKVSFAETYLIHSVDDIVHGIPKQNLIAICGNIRNLIHECSPPLEYILGEQITIEKKNVRARKIVRIEFLAGTLNLHQIENLNLTTEPDVMMEILLNNVRNDVISHQSFISKTKKQKMAGMFKLINELKGDFTRNEVTIFNLEKELNLLTDLDIRSELERFRHFDILHTEKMSPRFLALAKINKKSASLDSIKKVDGTDFEEPQQRWNYIRDFYQSIYTPAQGNAVLDPDCVEKFLGEEICNNPVVMGAKLTQEESLLYNRPLTIQELDNAINKTNPNSAGGLDGIGGKFIKQYWVYFRAPLLRYANFSLNTGTLSASFDSAGIRLIPKKGDCSQIKNWRPISLLNCIYKVIAKALDMRLSKINEISSQLTTWGKTPVFRGAICASVVPELC